MSDRPLQSVKNGFQDDEDDANTPAESLAVISKRVWEARGYAKAAMQAALNAHEEVKSLRVEVRLAVWPPPLLLVAIALLLGAILAKVW